MTRMNDGISRTASTLMAAFVVMPSMPMVHSVPETSLAAALREGDIAFHAFDNETARVSYQRAFVIDSTDCDVLWKLARSYVNSGQAAPEDERARWFVSAESLARRSVALCPDSSEAQFFLAVAIGQLTKVTGGKRKIELSKAVQREAEITLTINPRHAGAMHILGRWNYEIASLGWFSKTAAKIVYGGVPSGSYQQAREWFERAIAIRPDLPLNRLWLGETLIKLEDYPGAREELQTCLELDNVLWDDPFTKAHAEKTLRKIENKN